MSRHTDPSGARAFSVRPLDIDTWPAFARLVEANNGVWGGCWCIGFHVKLGKDRTPHQNRAEKEQQIILGARDLGALRDFYRRVGWARVMDDGAFSVFELRGIVLALFPLEPVDAEFFTGRSAYLCDPEGNYFEIVWADTPTNPVTIATRRATGL